MDFDTFQMVVLYQIQARSLKHFFTPSIDTINAVKEYNTLRAKAAKQKALASTELNNSLRRGHKIVQINTVPPHTKCCISKQVLNSGKTLIIHDENIKLYCVHQRFVNQVHNYYSIVHFDEEMFKFFKDWIKINYNLIEIKNKQDVYTLSEMFLRSESKIKFLYIKFNKICDL